MDIEFDYAKNYANRVKHGLRFEQIAYMDWDEALTKRDDRIDYKEIRLITMVPLEGRLCILVWTPRNGNIRPISFRKANAKERNRYEKDY